MKSKIHITKLDKVLMSTRKILKSKKVIPWVYGYITAQILKIEIKDIISSNFIDVFKNVINYLFNPDKIINILNIVAVCFYIFSIIIVKFLDMYSKKISIESRFSNYFTSKNNSKYSKYTSAPLSWQSCISISVSPLLDENNGWSASQIEIDLSSGDFSFNQELKEIYNNQLKTYKSFQKDNNYKYSLITLPGYVGSDCKSLKIELIKSKHSEVMFFNKYISNNETLITDYLDNIFSSSDLITFPSSLCFHIVIVTNNDRVLLTRRSSVVEYYPNAFSASLEEQFAEEDFKSENIVLNCAKRALREELGLNNVHYEDNNIKVLSLFLEADILNFALCGIVKLNISDKELDSIIKSTHRKDYEFQEWKFYKSKELYHVILDKSMKLHPTTEYRLILYLIYRFSFAQLASNLLDPKMLNMKSVTKKHK